MKGCTAGKVAQISGIKVAYNWQMNKGILIAVVSSRMWKFTAARDFDGPFFIDSCSPAVRTL